jgi:hypothetical protein
MAPARGGEPTVPHTTLNSLFEKMGEVQAVAREAKHAANNAGQKIDAVAGKVDALALVVATQGQLRDHVERLERQFDEQEDEINELKAVNFRREGAVGLVEWISKHWPFLGLSVIILAWVGVANGIFHR